MEDKNLLQYLVQKAAYTVLENEDISRTTAQLDEETLEVLSEHIALQFVENLNKYRKDRLPAQIIIERE